MVAFDDAAPARLGEAETPAWPIANTRPAIRYVGDAACAGCHADKAKSYARHSMGRALVPVRDLLDQETTNAPLIHSFEHQDWRCRVERRGNRLFHRVQLGDVEASVCEAEVQFVLGSGRQGRSYLINHDGYLFQSPVSWYSSKRAWGPSPGYADAPLLFTRPITEQCLFCHSNGPAPVEGSVNHYPQPIFSGYGIGCERCHGPGQLHVEAQQRGDSSDGADRTIVNPGKLAPVLRDAVCEQCHLLGDVRIARRSRSIHDYRPGLPLHEFLSVFVRPATEAPDREKAISELQQFYTSACYIKSRGQMGCIACHDPHGEPSADQRVSWYRDRCLTCHDKHPCALAADTRRQHVPDDSCIACHMPRKQTGNIAHAALSDHRIPRRPDQSQRIGPNIAPGDPPLRHFHEAFLSPSARDETERDLALAILQLSHDIQPAGQRLGAVQSVLPLLEQAVARAPDDREAQAALGSALGELKRYDAALTILDKVLTCSPRSEEALAAAGRFAAASGRPAEAVRYYKRVIEVNPWMPGYHYRLALCHQQLKDLIAAADACRAAIRLEPTHAPARRLLVAMLMQQGNEDTARAEFRILLATTPHAKDELQRWFDGLSK